MKVLLHFSVRILTARHRLNKSGAKTDKLQCQRINNERQIQHLNKNFIKRKIKALERKLQSKVYVPIISATRTTNHKEIHVGLFICL